MDKSACLGYIQRLDERKDKLDYWMLDHLRINGIYWALTAVALLNGSEPSDFAQYCPLGLDDIVQFVQSCQQPDGGYSGNVGHDSHLLFTLSAVQIMAILGRIDSLDGDRIAQCKLNVHVTMSFSHC